MPSKSARKSDSGSEKDKTIIDPSIASLFDSSFGAVKPPSRPTRTLPANHESEPDDEEIEEEDQTGDDDSASQTSEEPGPEVSVTKKERKRKRTDDNEDLEGNYMKKLEAAEAAAEKRRDRKKVKTNVEDEKSDSESDDEDKAEEENTEAESKLDIPRHETQVSAKDEELDKSNRSIFLGNVPSSVISSKSDYKKLRRFFATCGKVSSIRFRSVAFSEQIPRKAAFVNHKLHEKQKTVNAYVVYKDVASARDALKLNGSVLLDRHIRVDSVAHPAKQEPRRCVFVGNLDFEAQEENLWRHFAKCGTVETVRVVRDAKTNVGKGFAYVQFEDAMAVDQALLLDGKKMEGDRKLRVTRAKTIKRRDKRVQERRPEPKGGKGKIYVPKADPKQQAILGRASKLLGRAGASQLKKQSEIFEGLRATETTDPGLKKGGTGKKKGKPRARAMARSSAWKNKK